MKISGWGNRPVVESDVSSYSKNMSQFEGFSGSIRGLGRSYGDSSVNDSAIEMSGHDRFVGFDSNNGILVCHSGVSLDQILRVFVPKGWFLPVTPGTKFVTVGGAIASDVHGKNHHHAGCFSEHVNWLDLLIADGSVLRCSRTENSEVFRATCGGMGLTGIILSASVNLKKINSSHIDQTTYKTKNLSHTLELFTQTSSDEYSVAWIDCMAQGDKQGRCILTTGAHANEGGLSVHTDGQLTVPFMFPEFSLNSISVKAFNTLYYHRVREDVSRQVVHYDPYFYPLDKIHKWNRMYGRSGFIQYQFVVPYESGFEALSEALKAMASSGRASFLAVLKHLGDRNENYLSFPMSGYTLAVDFKWHSELPRLIEVLDKVVCEHGGRVYLTKDSMMNHEMLRNGYSDLDLFLSVRTELGAGEKFVSMQSKRLKI